MKIDVIENGEPAVYYYERLGQCNHCGDCCRRRIGCHGFQVTGSLSSLMDDQGDFSQYDDGTVLIQFLGVHWLFSPCTTNETQECPHLKNERCDRWMKQLSHPLCYFWPVHPDNLSEFPNCGFSFERIDYTQQ